MSDEEEIKTEYEEKFKVLLSAYRKVLIFIIENGEVQEEDTEETLIRKEFENMNLIKVNKKSVTLSIPKSQTNAWLEALEENFGTPINQNVNGNGHQFKTPSGVSIKIWEKKKYQTFLKECLKNVLKIKVCKTTQI